MASIPVIEENHGAGEESGKGFIRVILADTQAIFRAGLRKIFALEDDIRVVGQAETQAQALSAVKKFSADVLIFESALAPNPALSFLREHRARTEGRENARSRRRGMYPRQ